MPIVKSLSQYGFLLKELEEDIGEFVSRLNEVLLIGVSAYNLFVQCRAGITSFSDVESIVKKFNSTVFLDVTIDLDALDILLDESMQIKEADAEPFYKQIIQYFLRRSIVVPILKLGGLNPHRFPITDLFDQSLSDILPLFLETYVDVKELESLFSYIRARLNYLIFPKISQLKKLNTFEPIFSYLKSKIQQPVYTITGILSLLLYPFNQALSSSYIDSLAKEKYNLTMAILEEIISRTSNSLDFARLKTLIFTPENFAPRTNKLDTLLKYLIEERIGKQKEKTAPSYINELKDAIKKRRENADKKKQQLKL